MISRLVKIFCQPVACGSNRMARIAFLSEDTSVEQENLNSVIGRIAPKYVVETDSQKCCGGPSGRDFYENIFLYTVLT